MSRFKIKHYVDLDKIYHVEFIQKRGGSSAIRFTAMIDGQKVKLKYQKKNMGECYKMDIMKLNGFSIKPLKKGYYVVIKDDNKKLVYLDKDIYRCFAYIQNKGVINNEV